MNKIFLIGRLTKDPDLRYTSTNIAVVSFTLAVNRNFKNQSGEIEADFINCLAFKNQAENLAKYQKKGSQIAVSGRLQVRDYQDKNGSTRYITEVVCDDIQYLDSKKNDTNTDFYNATEAINKLDIKDEDLPF